MFKIKILLCELEISEKIRKTIDINKFITSSKKTIDNVNKDLMDQIIDRYGDNKNVKTDKKNNFQKYVGMKQAMKTLETLKFYEEQQEKGNLKFLKELRK